MVPAARGPGSNVVVLICTAGVFRPQENAPQQQSQPADPYHAVLWDAHERRTARLFSVRARKF